MSCDKVTPDSFWYAQFYPAGPQPPSSFTGVGGVGGVVFFFYFLGAFLPTQLGDSGAVHGPPTPPVSPVPPPYSSQLVALTFLVFYVQVRLAARTFLAFSVRLAPLSQPACSILRPALLCLLPSEIPPPQAFAGPPSPAREVSRSLEHIKPHLI